MPRRFLRGRFLGLSLTVIALALGVALVAAMDLVNRAVLHAFSEVIDTMAGRAALQVVAGSGAFFDERLAADVASIDGVEQAVPVVSASTFAGEGEEVLSVHGFALTDREAVRVYEPDDRGLELEDEILFLNRADSIAVTREFAARRGLALGSELVLQTPRGRRPFVVRGLLEPRGIAKLFGGDIVLLDLFAAEAAFAEPGQINRIDVVVDRRADVAAVAARIRGVVPSGLRVEPPAQRKADLHKVMQSLQTVLQGLALIGLIAAFLISFNRLSTMYEERAWQLGVLRAVGLNSRALRRELLKESLIVGLAGVGLGLPLGVLLGRLLLPAIAATTAIAYQLSTPAADVQVRPWSLAVAAAMGMIAVVCAALLPARRASRVAAIETIRGRGREAEIAPPRRSLAALALVAASIAVVIAIQARTRVGLWGVAATVLIPLATALAARPLIALLDSPRLPGLRALSGATGRFARDAVAQHPRRSALTAAMLGVGLGAVLWLWMVGGSFENSVGDFVAQVSRCDFLVSSARSFGGYRETPIEASIVGELRAIPGVLTSEGQRVVDWTYRGATIAINAFDGHYFSEPYYGRHPLVRPLPNAREDMAAGRAIWVSDSFAYNFDLDVGDIVTFDTPEGPLSLPIAALTPDFESPAGVVEMQRDLFRRYFHDDTISRAQVLVEPGVEPASVRAEIQRRLATRYGLRILTGPEGVDYFRDAVRRAFRAIDLLAAAVLFVVLVGIADTLAAGVVDRTRLFAAMRAVGARGGHIQRLVIAEGLLLGGIGLLLAVGCGLALGALWIEATFTYLLGWMVTFYLPWRQLVLLIAVTIAVCILAAWLPARRAARLPVSEALRWE